MKSRYFANYLTASRTDDLGDLTAKFGDAHNRGNLKELPMPPAHESSNFLRRKRLLLIPPLIGLLTGFLISFLFAARYVSSAKMSLNDPPAPSGYVIMPSSIIEEFESFTRLALSGTRMRPAVRRLNLVQPGQREEPLIEDIRTHVIVTPLNNPSDLTPIFSIGYSDLDPLRAQNICQMLTALIMDASQEDRDLRSSSTYEFLKRQQDDAKARVTTLEKEVTTYRKKGRHRSAEEESRYRTLLHDYEEAKSIYAIFLQKQAQAEMERQHERESEKARVTLLSPASLPSTPAFPNRVFCAGSGLATTLLVEILLMLYFSRGAGYMSQRSRVGTTNWWGLSSAVGLFAWFLYFYFKNGPSTFNGHVLFWGVFVLIHFCGINAARRRHGWLYLTPLGVFWVIVIVGLRGGTPWF